MNKTFPKELKIKLNSIGRDLTDEEKQSIKAKQEFLQNYCNSLDNQIKEELLKASSLLGCSPTFLNSLIEESEMKTEFKTLVAMGFCTKEQLIKLHNSHSYEDILLLVYRGYSYKTIAEIFDNEAYREFRKSALQKYSIVGGSITGNFFNPVFNLKIREKWHK
jgi:hypothetical protein